MLNFLKLLHTQPVCLWLYPDIEWFGCRWIHLIAAVLLCSVLLIRHKDWAYTRSEHTHCCTSSSVCVSASIVLFSSTYAETQMTEACVLLPVCLSMEEFNLTTISYYLLQIIYIYHFKSHSFILIKVIYLFGCNFIFFLLLFLGVTFFNVHEPLALLGHIF